MTGWVLELGAVSTRGRRRAPQVHDLDDDPVGVAAYDVHDDQNQRGAAEGDR